MVKNLLANAEDIGSIPGQGTKSKGYRMHITSSEIKAARNAFFLQTHPSFCLENGLLTAPVCYDVLGAWGS